MLFADTFRGEHSTGVMSYFSPYKEDSFVKVAKKAVPGDQFIRAGMFDTVKEHRKSTKNAVSGLETVSSIYPKFMVGHNRYATAGAVNDKNAHPFSYEHITLVHNGSLVDQSLLPDHKLFEVDSENVCYSIAKLGIEETIKKLHGAFVLVWHDSKLNTLNFIRNSERPFYMMKTTTNDWYGASEKDMIKWIMSRKKFNPTIEKEFELEVGVQYIFEATDGLRFKEEVKHELPTFRSTYSYSNSYWPSRSSSSYYDDYDDYDYTGRTVTKPHTNRVSTLITKPSNDEISLMKHRQLNEMLRAHGLDFKIGQRIKFESYQFGPYPKNKEQGQLTGWVGESEYIEVQGHGVNSSIVKDKEGFYTGKVISCYESNYVLTLIVNGVENFEPATNIPIVLENLEDAISDIPQSGTSVDTVELGDDEDDDEDGNVMDVTRDGSAYTKKEWEGNECLNTCGNCGSPLPSEEMHTATVFRDYAYCDGCVDAGQVDGLGPTVEGNSIVVERFSCIECDEELPVDAESEKECVCLQCYSTAAKYKKPEGRPILTYRKTLQNGMKVTLSQWGEMNTCSWCKTKIPFNKATVTEFFGSTPCCLECSNTLEAGKIPARK